MAQTHIQTDRDGDNDDEAFLKIELIKGVNELLVCLPHISDSNRSKVHSLITAMAAAIQEYWEEIWKYFEQHADDDLDFESLQNDSLIDQQAVDQSPRFMTPSGTEIRIVEAIMLFKDVETDIFCPVEEKELLAEEIEKVCVENGLI